MNAEILDSIINCQHSLATAMLLNGISMLILSLVLISKIIRRRFGNDDAKS